MAAIRIPCPEALQLPRVHMPRQEHLVRVTAVTTGVRAQAEEELGHEV